MIREWTTHLTVCRQGRITYRAEWSPSRPWASYWLGTAGAHFASVEQAAEYFKRVRKAKLEVKS